MVYFNFLKISIKIRYYKSLRCIVEILNQRAVDF